MSKSLTSALLICQLHILKLLGIDTIHAVPGAVAVDFIPCAETVRYDLADERGNASSSWPLYRTRNKPKHRT